ncbi:hypothetical protein Tco_0233368 [Tanacetum coccineum]
MMILKNELPDRKQKEPGKPKEEIYLNSKIVQVIKTYWELGHENKFITEIVARRANDCIVSITEPDYKNLNKNDIEDIYLLIMNGKVPDYADTGLLWSLSVFIRNLTKDETEYLKLFEEEIEERLKHRSQMRRWEMYVNGRPLGSRETAQLSNEQALHLITDQSASSPIKIKALWELPKMEAAVQQYHVDKQCFEIQKKQFLIENDRLLDQIISQDIVNIVVNSSADVNTSVKVNSFVVMNDSVNNVEM